MLRNKKHISKDHRTDPPPHPVKSISRLFDCKSDSIFNLGEHLEILS